MEERIRHIGIVNIECSCGFKNQIAWTFNGRFRTVCPSCMKITDREVKTSAMGETFTIEKLRWG